MDEHTIQRQDCDDHKFRMHLGIRQFFRVGQRVEQQKTEAGQPQDTQADVNNAGRKHKNAARLVTDFPAQKEPKQHQIQERCAPEAKRQSDKMDKPKTVLNQRIRIVHDDLLIAVEGHLDVLSERYFLCILCKSGIKM